MGKKQNRRGKHFHLFFACFIIVSTLLSGCANLYERLVTKPDFEQAEDLVRQEDYNAAAGKYEQIIARHPLVGDAVLFQLGIIYALPQNQHKDYHKALEYFQRLVKNYPESKYRRDSDVLVSLVNDILIKDKKMSTQHKQLDKLEQKLEQMKKVDMNLKQRKKNSSLRLITR
ncbi:MAG: tetratricopeptide repeat protein [Smithellaceae bacterium]